jgi:hypothetical protein
MMHERRAARALALPRRYSDVNVSVPVFALTRVLVDSAEMRGAEGGLCRGAGVAESLVPAFGNASHFRLRRS